MARAEGDTQVNPLPVCSCSLLGLVADVHTAAEHRSRREHEHTRGQRYYYKSVQWWSVGSCGWAASPVLSGCLAGLGALQTVALENLHGPTNPHLNIRLDVRHPITGVQNRCTTEHLLTLNTHSLLTFSPEHLPTGHPITEHISRDFRSVFAWFSLVPFPHPTDSQSSRFPLPTPPAPLRCEGEAKTCHPEKPL
jgi:hypothetical protein